jgi:hypothetical protein
MADRDPLRSAAAESDDRDSLRGDEMTARSARGRGPSLHELCAAPCAGLLLVLCIWLAPRAGIGDRERCVCGAILGPSRLPRLQGPERLLRAPVLTIDDRTSPWTATLDGSEVDGEPRDEEDPDWKIAKLAERLEVMAHNRRIHRPGDIPGADLVLSAPAGFPAKQLRRILYTLGLVHHTRVQLLLRGRANGKEWYSAAYLKLVSGGDCCEALDLSSFRTYEDLARAVVALRRVGRPALLAILPR